MELVAKDWTEFELHLEHLYENRELVTKLGDNGRVAAEKYFNYEKLAEFFLEDLVTSFTTNNSWNELNNEQDKCNSSLL